MAPPPERRWLGLLVGYVVFLGLLALIATPLYLSATSSFRPAVVRLVVAVIVGVALSHLLRTVRTRIDAQPLSTFEAALRRMPAESGLPPHFLRLRDEVRFSMASQSYFEHVLWPRIRVLLEQGPGRPLPEGTPKPSGRRFRRRGPSLITLRNLIAAIEERV
jgi:hypothetical protein